MCVLLDALGPALREATPVSAHGEAGGLRGHNLVQHSFVGLVQQSIRQAEMPKPPASPWCSQTAFIPRTSLRRTCGRCWRSCPACGPMAGWRSLPCRGGKLDLNWPLRALQNRVPGLRMSVQARPRVSYPNSLWEVLN